MFGFFARNSLHEHHMLPNYVTAVMGDALRHGHVDAIVRNGRVVATASWLAPGNAPRPWQQELRVSIGSARGVIKGRNRIKGIKLLDAMAKKHPEDPHWYLGLLGVDPAFQGKGLGGTLLTHRLRNLKSSDAEWIYTACQDEEVQRWTKVPRPYTREHAEAFIKNKNGELAAWAIIDSRSQEPVGMIGIHHVINGVASIGYWVAPWGRKSGAASTALQIIPTLARRVGKAHTLQATIAETNTASRRTAERAGFTLFGDSADLCPDGSASAKALIYQMTGPVA